MPLAGDCVPNPSPGIFDVTGAPGNQVDVAVKYRLASGFPIVDAQVETLHSIVDLQYSLPFLLD